MQIYDPDPVDCNLKNINILNHLPDHALELIERKCTWLKFGPDDVVLDRFDDDQNEVFFLVKGRVRILNLAGDETEIALADLEAGANFGELSAIDCRGRSARVQGSDHCIIARLDRDDFISMLMEFPKIALDLLDHFASIIRNMTERVTSLTALSAHQRIFNELVRIADPNPRGDGSWIIGTVPSHAEIASWSGTNKAEVANAIGGLVRNGILERHHRSYKINDHEKLKLLAHLS
jgi:CRP/FNR family cyclic AMP-dependent transcriptional regulator